MSKDHRCHSDRSCDSPSDHSEVCHDVRCERKCGKQHCCIKQCDSYTPEEIVCLYKDAVVEIHSEFILLGTGSTGATGGTPLGINSRTDVIVEGNGFFIKGHYIIAPSHLVLMPPSLTSVAHRYPLDTSPSNSPPPLGQIQNKMVRASRILVSVFNVNSKGYAFVYEAELVGVDGAGDVAVLRINYGKQWNRCNPCIEKCHPYFTFGDSRAAKDGEKVYIIGDYISSPNSRRLFNAVGAVSEGLLSDHRYIDYSGNALQELVLISAPAYAFSSGLPILDSQGRVIGMQTTDLATVLQKIPLISGIPLSIYLNQGEGSGFVAGPSEFFMRRIIKALIKGTCGKKQACQLQVICDPAGSYYRYRKAYAGIAYDVFTGVDYDVTQDYTSGSLTSGIPRIRLSSTGDFLSSPSCKEIVGIRVLGLAGANPGDASGVANGYYYVPGGTAPLGSPLVQSLPVSGFLGKLNPGDVITHIGDSQGRNMVPLGDLKGQIAPSLVTWRLCEGDRITLCYRRGGNALNTSDNSIAENYENLQNFTGCLGEFPELLDYPWYSVDIFPLISIQPYPGFVFPNGQFTNPQIPSLTFGAPFHPSF